MGKALSQDPPPPRRENDQEGRSSPALSAFIARVLELHGHHGSATLATIRQTIRGSLSGHGVPLDRLSAARLNALREEVDALILAHGEQSRAICFLRPWVSAPLRWLIAAADPGCTLGGLLRGLNEGLFQRPMADGGFPTTEVELMDAELRALVARYGHQLPASRLLSRGPAESTIPVPVRSVTAR